MTTLLRQYIAQESDSMLKTLRSYLYRAGVDYNHLDDAACELWQEVVVEALRHEDRFQRNAQPRPWLLGIATNLIKRRQQSIQRRESREPLVGDLQAEAGTDDIFDWLANRIDQPDQSDVEEEVTALLNHLSAPDQRLVQLAFWNNLDGNAIAQTLRITPGLARVRLHRALRQLRQIYFQVREHDGI